MGALKKINCISPIILNTADVNLIKNCEINFIYINPDVVHQAIQKTENGFLLEAAITASKAKGGCRLDQCKYASNLLTCYLCSRLLPHISGSIIIELNAYYSFNIELIKDQANKIISLCNRIGIDKSRIIISLVATWEGIQAAKLLQSQGKLCLLTQVYSFAQVRAATEAGIFAISPSVDTIYQWQLSKHAAKNEEIETDLAISLIYKFNYYIKQHGFTTKLIPCNISQEHHLLALIGCDKINVSPQILENLKIDENKIASSFASIAYDSSLPTPIDANEFRWLHHQSPMAVEKLSAGIRQIALDHQKLEDMLLLHL